MSADSPRFPSRRVVLGGIAAPLFTGPGLAQEPAKAPTSDALLLRKTPRSLRPGAPGSAMIGPYSAIRLKKGQLHDFEIINRLGEPAAVHVHGLRSDNGSEGMPGLGGAAVADGANRTVRLRANDAGTFLYLPVLQGKTSEHQERGLAGMLIVDEPNPQAIDLETVAILDDIRLNAEGVLEENFGARVEAARFGRLGNTLTTNGKIAPDVVVARPNARVRLRLASVANARIMPMKFEGGRQTVVAIDGQACDPFDPLKRTVVLLPGSRYELMLDMPAAAGQEAAVLVDLGTLYKVLIFKTEGEPLPQRPPVEPLPANDVPPAIRLQNAARAEVAISGGLPRPPTGASGPLPSEEELARQFPDKMKIWSINNGFNSGFSGKPVLTVKRGTPVVLALTNRSAWPQVLTVHGHVFRLLHPLDDGWEPYFLDTIHLPAMTTSRIAFDAANPGKWAIRSTIAEHYDSGVATWFEVTP